MCVCVCVCLCVRVRGCVRAAGGRAGRWAGRRAGVHACGRGGVPACILGFRLCYPPRLFLLYVFPRRFRVWSEFKAWERCRVYLKNYACLLSSLDLGHAWEL